MIQGFVQLIKVFLLTKLGGLLIRFLTKRFFKKNERDDT